MQLNAPPGIRIALVHHWLVAQRGGEQVLEAMGELFPTADLFTLVHDPSQIPLSLRSRRLVSSFLQKFPRPSRWYRYYLPLFPMATEHLDLGQYDLVISSDAATVKGVRVGPHATHICYCHSPMRYIWSGHETYARSMGTLPGLALRAVRTPLRRWDYQAAQRVTDFVANSLNVQRRIQKAYDRDSVVIYPPVDTGRFVPPARWKTRQDFFLFVSQLVPYKGTRLLVETFNKCGKPLVVIGDGPEFAKLQRRAKSNIEFVGSQPQTVVIEAMQRCRGFVFAGEEDFGIVMAEAQACGAPVIALARGGATEIVQEGRTGILFEEPTIDSLMDGLQRFERERFDSSAIRAATLRFERQRFLSEFSEFVSTKLAAELRTAVV